jgi:hypothetical protein
MDWWTNFKQVLCYKKQEWIHLLSELKNHENLKTDYPSKPVCYSHLNTEALSCLIWSHINLKLCQNCIWKTRWQKGSVAYFTEKNMALLNNHSNPKTQNNLHWLRDDQRPIHKVLLHYEVGIVCCECNKNNPTHHLLWQIQKDTLDKFLKHFWKFKQSQKKYVLFQQDVATKQTASTSMANITLFLWTVFKIIRYFK